MAWYIELSSLCPVSLSSLLGCRIVICLSYYLINILFFYINAGMVRHMYKYIMFFVKNMFDYFLLN